MAVPPERDRENFTFIVMHAPGKWNDWPILIKRKKLYIYNKNINPLCNNTRRKKKNGRKNEGRNANEKRRPNCEKRI